MTRLTLLIAIVACSACRAIHVPAPDRVPRYDVEPYRALLAACVEGGRVDYARLEAEHSADLDRQLDAVARFGPTATPEQFPTEAQRLAYWLNAYNAAVLRRWLDAGAGDGRADRRVNVLWFFLDRWRIDGRWMTLDHLEQQIVRRRFDEPRIHFALVCGAAGCPPLLDRPFDGTRLGAQLDELGTAWFAARGAIDLEGDTALVSPILSWYAGDFGRVGGLPALVERYVAPDDPSRGGLLEAVRAGRIRYRSYDWTINSVPR